MRFYVVWKEEKIYLRFDREPRTRWDVVAEMQGGVAFDLSDEKDDHLFHINDIIATPEFGTWDLGVKTVVGSFIGILFGPIGMVIGGGLAMISHHYQYKREKLRAELFNKTKLKFPDSELEEVKYD